MEPVTSHPCACSSTFPELVGMLCSPRHVRTMRPAKAPAQVFLRDCSEVIFTTARDFPGVSLLHSASCNPEPPSTHGTGAQQSGHTSNAEAAQERSGSIKPLLGQTELCHMLRNQT